MRIPDEKSNVPASLGSNSFSGLKTTDKSAACCDGGMITRLTQHRQVAENSELEVDQVVWVNLRRPMSG